MSDGRPTQSVRRTRHAATIGTRQLLVIMVLAFCVFFGGRVIWSSIPVLADQISAVHAAIPAPRAPTASADRWTNSLGMEFIRAGNVWLANQETRNQDFGMFLQASGYKAGAAWDSATPSDFANGPVSGVSWEDAAAFCRWLTETERREGRLAAGQSYRLPTEEEWTRLRTRISRDAACGESKKVLWEWCQDVYENDPNFRVYRIGVRAPARFQDALIAYRGLGCAARRTEDRTFRCVLQMEEERPAKLLAYAR
jgi:formylglycine-generating enzyme required for sulfatase activity